MSRSVIARVDLSALVHNYQVVRRIVGQQRQILAMIKADAYGHGLLQVAECLSDYADLFGVATLEEALLLRDAGIINPIVVMTGFLTKEQLDLHFQHQLSSVIHHAAQLDLLERYSSTDQINAWLKINTGMHRLGFSSHDFPQAYERLSSLSCIRHPITIMTHLADADNSQPAFMHQQLALFSELTESVVGPKSVLNSAGLIACDEEWLYDIVRPGIMLYGASPFPHRSAEEIHIKPVMHLTTQLIAIHAVKKGAKVGYGGTWECPEDMTIGVIRMGYGDGYPRHIDDSAVVLMGGVECPVIGRVSMDMMTVDLREHANANVGDEVVLWGHGLPVEKIAAAANTIPYELFCQLTSRVEFQYLP